MRLVVTLLVLSACGRVAFDPLGGNGDGGGGGGNGDGGGGDGNGGDGQQNACPTQSCAFNGIGPCSCWGTPMFQNAGLSESGALIITPNANTAGANGACVRTNTTYDSAGVIAEVSQIVQGAQSATTLTITTGPDILQISASSTSLIMTDGSNNSTITYDAPNMRWWRIRPAPGGGTQFETASDGTDWQMKYQVGLEAAASVTVTISGRTNLATAAPGSARFESINVCP